MNERRELSDRPAGQSPSLRERAAQARRLAAATTDKRVADALKAYATELEKEASRLESNAPRS